jgi:hypothetical protein
LKYAPDDVPAGANDYDLTLGWESDGQWERVSGCVVDSAIHQVSGSVTGFSSYGIFWPNAASTSAEYCNLVNNQVCEVLDAIREFNTGLLLMARGFENDFSQEYDSAETEYSGSAMNWIMNTRVQQ